MPLVFIPPQLRSVSGNADRIQIEAATVRQVVNALEDHFPGIRGRLCAGDALRPGLAVAIDGKVSSAGLQQKVAADSEVHFLPAIGGG
jgi:molybdopterin synthase sulfur carrier subunit